MNTSVEVDHLDSMEKPGGKTARRLIEWPVPLAADHPSRGVELQHAPHWDALSGIGRMERLVLWGRSGELRGGLALDNSRRL